MNSSAIKSILNECGFLKIHNFQLEPLGFSFEYETGITFAMLEAISESFCTTNIQVRAISADYGDTLDSTAVWIEVKIS
jgi:hypothetical protein